jgi:hypothetical protein
MTQGGLKLRRDRMMLLRQKAYTQVIEPKIREHIRRMDDGSVTQLAIQLEVVKLFEKSKEMCLRGFEPTEEYRRMKALMEGREKPRLESYFEAVAYMNLLPVLLTRIHREIQEELKRKKGDVLLSIAMKMVEEKIGS